MNIYEFIGSHPFLTFFVVLIIAVLIEEFFDLIKLFIIKNKK